MSSFQEDNYKQKIIDVKWKFNGAPHNHAANMVIYKMIQSNPIPSKMKNTATQKELLHTQIQTIKFPLKKDIVIRSQGITYRSLVGQTH